ncbi:MAG: hypothetical protein PSX71_03785 [bacterium]|nr:hypothetical protein [bacterium]
MKIELKVVPTRFRAYQLGEPGSSFSYFAGDHFTLIEARLTERSYESLLSELMSCGKSTIDTLHITSWDQDHCSFKELQEILHVLKPKKIEYPGYDHDSDNCGNCLEEIIRYQNERKRMALAMEARRIDPPYVNGLDSAKHLGYSDIFYHPREFYGGSNDNSTVKLFRSGMFNVASLGDIEHANIGAMLRRCRTFKSEVDILLLAHHGAKNDVNSKSLFRVVRPAIAVCSSDYDNQYGHPHDDVRSALDGLDILTLTTKRGDVLIESIPNHRKEYRVTDLISDSTRVSAREVFVSKKFHLLSMNQDSIRNRVLPGFKGLK